MSNQSISEMLKIFDVDISRKSKDTKSTYHYIANKFLNESGDFSRHGILSWLDSVDLSDNWHRVAHYAISRLCKSLEIKFPLDRDDLAAKPDEDTLCAPIMSSDDVKLLIEYWRNFPGEYTTSLVFMGTVFGRRSSEMSTTKMVDITKNSIVFRIAKRKALTVREYKLHEQYMKYVTGYENLSENNVRSHFRTALHKAGIKVMENQNWHSIRRRLVTSCDDLGIPDKLYKRFIGWAPTMNDMASVYSHHSFDTVTGIMLGQIPNPETGVFVKHPFLEGWK